MTNISKDKLEVAGKVLEPIGNFMSKTIHLIKQWKGLVVFSNINKMHNEAHKWMTNITSKGGIFSNPNIPPDLMEKNNKTILTADGKLVSGQVLISDYNFGEDAGIAELYLGLIVFGMIVLNIFGISKTLTFDSIFLIGKGAGGLAIIVALLAVFVKSFKPFATFLFFILYLVFIYSIINFQTDSLLLSIIAYSIPSLLVFFVSYNKDKKRAVELLAQSQKHNSTAGDSFVSANVDTPKVNQIRKAMADKTPFIEIGQATGSFYDNGDSHAPAKGITMGLTVNDLSQHLLITGKSGTGKSYTIRAVVGQIYIQSLKANVSIGIMVMCGKGDLAYEVSPVLDEIITPERVLNLNILNGIRPEQFQRILLTTNNVDLSKAGANLVFTQGAASIAYFVALTREKLLEMKTIALQEGIEVKASLNYMIKIANELMAPGYYKDGVLVSHPMITLLEKHPNYKKDMSIDSIIDYLHSVHKEKQGELLESFLANFNGWMSVFTQNTRFLNWCNSETSDIDITEILKGKKYGIALPTEEYGIAGEITTQFLKTSLYNAGALRRSGWEADKKQVKVLVIIDECQDIVTQDDIDQSQKMRSRGFNLIFGTQHFTNLSVSLGGEDYARALINSFSNYITLKTEDERTTKFFEESLGKIRITTSKVKRGPAIDFDHTNKVLMESIEFDNNHAEAHYIKFSGTKTKTTGLKFTSRSKYEKGGYANDINDEGIYATYQAFEESPIRQLYTEADQKSLEIAQHALLKVQRAGLVRADIVKLIGWSAEEFELNIKLAKLKLEKKVA